jgi:hypothetical protein
LECDLATLDRVKEKLRSKYERIKRVRGSTEGALMSRGKGGKFKGALLLLWHLWAQVCRLSKKDG